MASTNDMPNGSDQALADVGKSVILAPLIIGGAVIVSIIMLWTTHAEKQHVMDMSRIEESARVELRAAYEDLRNLRPEAALERIGVAKSMIASLKSRWPSDYTEMRIVLLLLEGEMLFMADCDNNAPQAEEKFDAALKLMPYSSGELWQFGLLGRARTRFEQGKYGETIADLDQMMSRNPNFGTAYYWRALAKKKIGDDVGAKADEQYARRLDSWPPLRDFMQSSVMWTRDILCRPDGYCEVVTKPVDRTLDSFFPGYNAAGANPELPAE